MVNKAKAKPKNKLSASSRVRPLTKKQAKQAAAKQRPVPSSFKLLKQTYIVLLENWRVLGGIVLVYLALNVVFASGLFGGFSNAISTARQTHSFSDALNGYSSLLGGSAGSSQGSSTAESLLFVFESLVIIWALRQLLAGQKIGVKQAFYHSMAPLVQFLLVIMVIIIQVLPLALGAALLSAILTGGVVSPILAILAIAIFGLLAAWSIYMVSGSILGIYIATLPDMQPRQALRSAKKLVHFRRWRLLRRLFFLPLFILVALGIITVPLILLLPFLVAPAFFVLLMVTILFAHTYLYSLYRELIG